MRFFKCASFSRQTECPYTLFVRGIENQHMELLKILQIVLEFLFLYYKLANAPSSYIIGLKITA